MPTQNTPPQLPLLIECQSDLDELCSYLVDYRQVFVDTEFVRTNTYAPQLGLIQLAAGGLTACVDPLAKLNMAELWALLFNQERSSIMHSAKQDMEVMWFDQGEIIHRLIDTQVCAALVGFPAQIGYAGLLNELLNIEIGKTQTRTDWSRRPLTEAQLQYAAEDVIHLPEMLQRLEHRLRELDRYEWALEDSNALCDVTLYKPEPTSAWQRIKSVPFLPPEQQARARALATWREARAVAADKPRGWILSDKALLQLATDNPQRENQLAGIDDLPPALARKQGPKILHILAVTNDAFAQGEIKIDQQQIDVDREKSLSKKMSQLVRSAAEELNIAAEVIASKRDINAVIRHEAGARVATGWRRAVIGDQLLELAN